MASTPVSPKVKAGANWAAYATLALTLLSTITPDSLSFLGVYSPLAYGVIVGGTYALGAYLKSDPLRQAPADPAPAEKPSQDIGSGAGGPCPGREALAGHRRRSRSGVRGRTAYPGKHLPQRGGCFC